MASLPADEIQVQRMENLLSFYKAESLYPLSQQVAKESVISYDTISELQKKRNICDFYDSSWKDSLLKDIKEPLVSTKRTFFHIVAVTNTIFSRFVLF